MFFQLISCATNNAKEPGFFPISLSPGSEEVFEMDISNYAILIFDPAVSHLVNITFQYSGVTNTITFTGTYLTIQAEMITLQALSKQEECEIWIVSSNLCSVANLFVDTSSKLKLEISLNPYTNVCIFKYGRTVQTSNTDVIYEASMVPKRSENYFVGYKAKYFSSELPKSEKVAELYVKDHGPMFVLARLAKDQYVEIDYQIQDYSTTLNSANFCIAEIIPFANQVGEISTKGIGGQPENPQCGEISDTNDFINTIIILVTISLVVIGIFIAITFVKTGCKCAIPKEYSDEEELFSQDNSNAKLNDPNQTMIIID